MSGGRVTGLDENVRVQPADHLAIAAGPKRIFFVVGKLEVMGAKAGINEGIEYYQKRQEGSKGTLASVENILELRTFTVKSKRVLMLLLYENSQ